MNMFRKTSHGDVKKSLQKVLDGKKDTVTRLKHLKLVLDNYEIQDTKIFFETNFSQIYYIFYETFVTVEGDLKQKANKAHREELDGILHVFEKILLLLPELVHRRWQSHSIGRIMKKLLHTGNSIKMRREGIRLFLIWYQILKENANTECHLLFASIVPDLGTLENLDADLFTFTETMNASPVDILPIIPAVTNEKHPENMARFLLEILMTFMVSEVNKVEWGSRHERESSFAFLFDQFKKFYLLNIFPGFGTKSNIYHPSYDIPDSRPLISTSNSTSFDKGADTLAICREVVVKWVATFTQDHKVSNKNETLKPMSPGSTLEQPYSGDGEATLTRTDTVNMHVAEVNSPNTIGGSPSSSDGEEPRSMTEYEIVKQVLYSSRENVNIVHEIFRQAFLFPFQHSSAMKRVVNVYRDWLQHVDSRPIFMQEAPCSEEAAVIVKHAISEHDGSCPSKQESKEVSENDKSDPRLRSNSYLGAVRPTIYDREGSSVRAGIHNTLQVLITNAANVFLMEPSKNNKLLDEQVDLCKRVLNIYRFAVMNIPLDQKTWEQLLMVLLRITSGVLQDTPSQKTGTLGSKMATAMFQTLIVTWIKANLSVHISTELWDHFLEVLSSLTHWVELIKEWAKTMETLTRVLARHVYNLDLHDLPLDRLSEQKQKKQDARQSSSDLENSKKRTFSRGWSTYNAIPAKLIEQISAVKQKIQEEREDMDGVDREEEESAIDTHRIHRQRSFSGGDSPGSLRASEAKASTLVRSNSDGNLPSTCNLDDSNDRLKGASFSSETSTQSFATINSITDTDEPDRLSADPSFTSQSTVTDSTSINSADSMMQVPYSIMDPCLESSHEEPTDSDYATKGSDHDTGSHSPPSPGSFHSHNSPSPETVHRHDSVDRAIMEQDSKASTLTNGDFLRRSRSPSLISRSRSPSPVDFLHGMRTNSDTPDRESIQLDVGITSSQEQSGSNTSGEQSSSFSSEEFKSVLAGGSMTGWLPEVAVVLWQRMLGSLGDINRLADPDIHAYIVEYLCELSDLLIKVRENQSVTPDNKSSPPPPEMIPPLTVFTPWLFQALYLPEKYKQGKLLAYRLLCLLTVRKHDITLTSDYLTQFYRAMHYGLVGNDQDIINTLVHNCGPNIFGMPLQGSSMLMLDFIHAANTITATTDLKQAPRTEAVSLLASLLCFPNHFGEMPVLSPNPIDTTLITCSDSKDHIVSILLRAGKKEPLTQARCVAICSLGVFVYEELAYKTFHMKLKEAINVLLASLRFNSKQVAQIASDMLGMIVDHVDTLLMYYPEITTRIIEGISSTICGILSTADISTEDDKKLIVAMMFCLLDWCMKIPMNIMLEKTDGGTSLLLRVFRVLTVAVTGSPLSTKSSQSCMDFNHDIDLDNIKDGGNPMTPDSGHRRTPSSSSGFGVEGMTVVKLAARYVLYQLQNHYGHFPSGIGATRINSLVLESHDITDVDHGLELSSDVLSSPSTQFFIWNNSVILSVIEIPLTPEEGQLTPGLVASKTSTRVIARDLIGRASWDSTLLFGPLSGQRGSYVNPEDCQNLLDVFNDMSMLSQFDIAMETRVNDAGSPVPEDVRFNLGSQSYSPDTRSAQSLDVFSQDAISREVSYDDTEDDNDNINELLLYIGDTSPECMLVPGEALTESGCPPQGMTYSAENDAVVTVTTQKRKSDKYIKDSNQDASMDAQRLQPDVNDVPYAPFLISRLLLNQLGFLQWSRRPNFDLLQKNEKLLRELKNLDKQCCRETHKIAVIYVAAGQEDKEAILSNTAGTQGFEQFVSGLGWEVDISTHTGFMGGLQSNRSTGDTAPYYSTSTVEIVYHVSTRFPSNNKDALHRKLRHLGNDEVQIVWSEHSRSYRRGIIPTEFGDVIIVIYPLQMGLYRIQIDKKSDIPYFGPLFDGAIVAGKILPGLVRATAINASRAKRSQMVHYLSFFEERAKCIDIIVQQRKEMSMFEEFAGKVFAPILPPDGEVPGSSLGNSGPFPSAMFSGLDQPKVLSLPLINVASTGLQRAETISEPVFDKVVRRVSFIKHRKSSIPKVMHNSNLPPETPHVRKNTVK